MSNLGGRKWTFGADGHGAYFIETDDCDGVQICYVRKKDHARLIAAAPELLEALDKASTHLAAIGYPADANGRYDKNGEWTFADALPRDVDAAEVKAAFQIIRSALAKAVGPQP